MKVEVAIPGARKLLESAETHEGEINAHAISERADKNLAFRTGREIYLLLDDKTTGEANVTVRSVTDTNNGLRAWREIKDFVMTKTNARMLKEYRAYTNAPVYFLKPKDITAFVAKWTTELKTLSLADPTYTVNDTKHVTLSMTRCQNTYSKRSMRKSTEADSSHTRISRNTLKLHRRRHVSKKAKAPSLSPSPRLRASPEKLLHRRPRPANASMIVLVTNHMPQSTQTRTYACTFSPRRAMSGASQILLSK